MYVCIMIELYVCMYVCMYYDWTVCMYVCIMGIGKEYKNVPFLWEGFLTHVPNATETTGR
jgi:hypothetical protein